MVVKEWHYSKSNLCIEPHKKSTINKLVCIYNNCNDIGHALCAGLHTRHTHLNAYTSIFQNSKQYGNVTYIDKNVWCQFWSFCVCVCDHATCMHFSHMIWIAASLLLPLFALQILDWGFFSQLRKTTIKARQLSYYFNRIHLLLALNTSVKLNQNQNPTNMKVGFAIFSFFHWIY